MPDPIDPRDHIYDWNARPGQRQNPVKVEFDDETLRDGLQSPSVVQPPINDRIVLLDHMVALGIHAVDLGLPGSGQDHFQASMALAQHIHAQALPLDANCACRTVVSDIEAVARVQDQTGLSIEAAMFLLGSRVRGVTEGWEMSRLLDTTITAVGRAKDLGLRIMYVTEDTTRAHPDDIALLYGAAIEHGATRVCLSDTVGHADPAGAYALVEHFRRLLPPSIKIDWHGHNDRGLAVANALAAYQAGVDRLHGTAMGIGERCGNCPMDTLLVNLRLMGVIKNDLTSLMHYVQDAARFLELPVPVGFPVIGEDAFRTGTGVHAAAIVKARKFGTAMEDAIYSGVPASLVGRKQEIVITTLSGHNGIRNVLEALGLPCDKGTVERVFNHAKAGNRRVEEADIRLVALNG